MIKLGWIMVINAILLNLLLSCNGEPKNPQLLPSELEALSSMELTWYTSEFPEATQKKTYTIPDSWLSEDEKLFSCNTILALYSDTEELLGYTREMTLLPSCSGVCKQFQFILVFNSDKVYQTIFNPEGSFNPLEKYWEDELVSYTEEDVTLLRSLLSNNPRQLLNEFQAQNSVDTITSASTSNDELSNLLIDSTTGATKEEFQNKVVRGSAYTTYMCLDSRLRTEELIQDYIAP